MAYEDERYAERVSRGIAAMSDEQRAKILGASIYHVIHDRLRGSWSVMGENGVVSMSHPSEVNAENWIIEGTGIFDE